MAEMDLKEQMREAGVDFSACYQCGKCTASCPVAFAMDYGPRHIVRFLQLGWWDEALKSRSIWLCAACDTCSTRCPRSVNPAKMMDCLRVQAGNRRIVAEPKVKVFNDTFLHIIRRYGRIHEGELAIRFNLITGQLFKDARLGVAMLRRGKIHGMPRRIRGIGTLRRIFAQTDGRKE
ncbi:MAG: heterodisulfide reductase subunit C [Syntrophomonadaceae bacterium]|nr:heterodisulfide reductase subunit C [Syntrophomonadaceae bacterium]